MRSALKVKKNGFTLIELLIVISIIAIISGAAIPSFNTYIKNQNVRQAQEQVKDDLRTVQNRALNGQDATKELDDGPIQYWGVRITDGIPKYTYFTSTDTSTCDSGNTSKVEDFRASDILPGGNVIRGGGGCIFFSMDNGDASFSVPGDPYTIIVGPSSGTGCRRIEINSSGLIKANNQNEDCT